MAKSKFTASVEDWVKESSEMLLRVTRQSTHDLINEASVPGPSKGDPTAGRGGKLPVDTGFLRASGAASLTGWPQGPGDNPLKVKYASETEYAASSSVSLNLAKMKLGDTFYFGWTAQYAGKMEMMYGFMISAEQNWQTIVDKNVRIVSKGRS